MGIFESPAPPARKLPMCRAFKAVIYVVDDNQDVQEALEGVLESVSLEVEAFRSAEDFLIRRRGDEIACLILDIRLPGMSGLELASRLRTKLNKPLLTP